MNPATYAEFQRELGSRQVLTGIGSGAALREWRREYLGEFVPPENDGMEVRMRSYARLNSTHPGWDVVVNLDDPGVVDTNKK